MDGEEALEKIGAGSAIVLVGIAIGTVLEYLLKVVLARFLGPESYGVFLQGLAIAQVMAVVAIFGFHMSLPRFMSYYSGKDEKSRVEGSFKTALYLVFPSAIVASVVLYFSAGQIATGIFAESALSGPLRIFALSILPLVLFYLLIGFFRGMKNARFKVYIEDIVFPVSEILIVLALFYLGFGLLGAAYAYLFALIITVIAGFYFYRELSETRFQETEFIPGEIMRFSWPLLVVSVLFIIAKWIDVLMLGWMTDSVQVGSYEVAFAVAGGLSLLASSLEYMFLPMVSELYGDGNIGGILSLYRTTTRWIFTLTLPLLAGMLIFSSEILNILFGGSYTAGATALMVLAVGYFYQAGTGLSGIIIVAVDKTEEFMIGIGLGTMVNILMNLALIPQYGILGAAFSTVASLFVMNTLLLLFARREISGFPYTRKFLIPVLGVIPAALLVYGAKSVLEPSIGASAVLGGVLVIIYVLLLYVSGGIQEDDVEMLRNLWGLLR